MGKENVCIEIQPSEDMMEFLKEVFVAELNHSLDAKAVQEALVMEGMSRVKVTGMGER